MATPDRDANMNPGGTLQQSDQQARAARMSTSVREPTAAASRAILVPVPSADLHIAEKATLQAAQDAELADSRERVMAAQLKLAHGSDEHDPHERSSAVHAALVEADAVSLSQRIMRASMITDARSVTVFDKIITKKVPAFVVYEDEDVLAFHDSTPQAPVHIVIIPKFRDGLTGLSTAEERHKKILGQLLYTASRVAKMEDGLRDGYRVVINEGGWGGQTVLHLHLHLLGGRFMQWPPG